MEIKPLVIVLSLLASFAPRPAISEPAPEQQVREVRAEKNRATLAVCASRPHPRRVAACLEGGFVIRAGGWGKSWKHPILMIRNCASPFTACAVNEIDTDNVLHPYYGLGIFDEIVLRTENRKRWEAVAVRYAEQFISQQEMISSPARPKRE